VVPISGPPSWGLRLKGRDKGRGEGRIKSGRMVGANLESLIWALRKNRRRCSKGRGFTGQDGGGGRKEGQTFLMVNPCRAGLVRQGGRGGRRGVVTGATSPGPNAVGGGRQRREEQRNILPLSLRTRREKEGEDKGY